MVIRGGATEADCGRGRSREFRGGLEDAAEEEEDDDDDEDDDEGEEEEEVEEEADIDDDDDDLANIGMERLIE